MRLIGLCLWGVLHSVVAYFILEWLRGADYAGAFYQCSMVVNFVALVIEFIARGPNDRPLDA